jgi:hypothetical protein
MSKFLDDFLGVEGDPEHENENEIEALDDELEVHDDEVEDDSSDEGVAEEIEAEAEPEGAPEATETVEDDETELTPAERKAYGRLKALQDERTKRQSAEEDRKAAIAERDRYQNELADMRRQQAEAAARNLPDFYEDPEGYRTALEAQYQEQLVRQSLGYSLERAIDKHGEEEVTAAAAWFENQMAANPTIDLRGNMLAQKDQLEWVYQSYKEATQMSAFARGDYSGIVAELQKQGFIISKADNSAGAASVAPSTQQAPAQVAVTAQTTPLAPKRSKLAGAQGATTAPKNAPVSYLDVVTTRRK